MIDLSAPPTIRLTDYRPPAWLIPEVALRFELGAGRTRVHARLEVVRNGSGIAPLVLDGEDLTLVSMLVDA